MDIMGMETGVPCTDNYYSAWIARRDDAVALSARYEGAMHLGGIAIECMLKHMAKQQHNLPLPLEGHNLEYWFNRVRPLVQRKNADVDAWLKRVQHPVIITKGEHVIEVGYISVRYLGGKLTKEQYDEWYAAYNSLHTWLLKQLETLGRRS